MFAPGETAQLTLLPLRQDLELHEAPCLENGTPTWTLQDPVRNLFFRIGRSEMEMLARWECGDGDTLTAAVGQETGIDVTLEEVEHLQRFLLQNALLAPNSPTVQARLEQTASRKQPSLLSLALHHYLFFRIPLWKPDTFLERTLPLVRPLGSTTALILYGCIALLALILVTPQWSLFFSTFPYFFTPQGAVLYATAIFFVKLLHELGHGYTSKHYGLRVSTMGVAFVVLWPMLYSDNGDAWKLKEKSKRMRIVMAGIGTELVIAAVATLAWTLLQPGIAKSICFVLATSSLLSSLLINVSPFMRFDGYYLLSDYLDIPNLAPRAFALGRWRLRKLLLGLDTGRPEPFSGRTETTLLAYCYSTWIYRFFLLTGIALMVYHLFFKALGVFLFSVEIMVFIVMPIYRELKAWWTHRELLGCNGHIVTTVTVLLAMVAFLCIPLPTSIVLPAVYTAQDKASIYPPYPARIDAIHVRDGSRVKKGDSLFSLSSMHLESQERITDLEIAALQSLMEREMTSREHMDNLAVTMNELSAALSKKEGFVQQRERLEVRAPFSGMVSMLSREIEPGIWVAGEQRLCLVVGNAGGRIAGYLREEDLERLPDQAEGLFTADTGDRRNVRCRLESLDRTAPKTLQSPELSALHGGDVAVLGTDPTTGAPLLAETRYRMVLTPVDETKRPNRMQRGHVVLRSKPRPIILGIWKSLASGLIRESGL
jgi:putative peptide zinc metalloprotease protein